MYILHWCALLNILKQGTLRTMSLFVHTVVRSVLRDESRLPFSPVFLDQSLIVYLLPQQCQLLLFDVQLLLELGLGGSHAALASLETSSVYQAASISLEAHGLAVCRSITLLQDSLDTPS